MFVFDQAFVLLPGVSLEQTTRSFVHPRMSNGAPDPRREHDRKAQREIQGRPEPAIRRSPPRGGEPWIALTASRHGLEAPAGPAALAWIDDDLTREFPLAVLAEPIHPSAAQLARLFGCLASRRCAACRHGTARHGACARRRACSRKRTGPSRGSPRISATWTPAISRSAFASMSARRRPPGGVARAAADARRDAARRSRMRCGACSPVCLDPARRRTTGRRNAPPHAEGGTGNQAGRRDAGPRMRGTPLRPPRRPCRRRAAAPAGPAPGAGAAS